MKKLHACAAPLFALPTVSASATETIGVSMGLLGNNLFQTLVRDGMDKDVKTLNGVTLQVEDASGDVDRQFGEVRNFIASGVTAIIIDPADSRARGPRGVKPQDFRIGSPLSERRHRGRSFGFREISSEEVDHAPGCGVIEKSLEVPCRLCGNFGASRKQVPLICGQCGPPPDRVAARRRREPKSADRDPGTA